MHGEQPLELLAVLLQEPFHIHMWRKKSRDYLTKKTNVKAGCIIAGAILAMIGICNYIQGKEGVNGRLPLESELLINERNNFNVHAKECAKNTNELLHGCIYGGNNIKAIVIGDSHADATVTAIAAALPDSSSGLLAFTSGGCPVLLNANAVPGKINDSHCFDLIRKKISIINKEYPNIPVIVINRWAMYAVGRNEQPRENNIPYVYFDKLEPIANYSFIQEYKAHIVSTMCTLASTRKVYLLGPIPELIQDVPSTLARQALWGAPLEVKLKWQTYIKRQKFILEALDQTHQQCGVDILDPTKFLCTSDSCNGTKDGYALYYDDDHLSERGNKLLVPLFKRVFE